MEDLEQRLLLSGLPLAVTAAPAITATEGGGGIESVATFTDPNGDLTTTQYQATVTWGDNAASGPPSISGPDANGVYTVTVLHNFPEEKASETATVTVTRNGVTLAASVTDTFDVADAPLSATAGASISTTVGATYSGNVATFSDGNFFGGSVSDFSATIDWGDSSAFTTVAGAQFGVSIGTFTIPASHIYTEAGTFTVKVSVHDVGGAAASASLAAQVASTTLNASASPVVATEGASFSGTVATFTGTSTGSATDYSATIDWNDSTAPTTVSGSQMSATGDSFSVPGGHVYAEDGNYTLTVIIRDKSGATATVRPVATVADAALSTTGAPIGATVNVPFSGEVASFTDQGGAEAATNYSAQIDWGDKSTSKGTVVAGGTGFQVMGSHTYTSASTASLPLVVTIADDGGSTAVTTGSAAVTGSTAVAGAALVATPVTVQAPFGTAFNGAVATFTDSDGATAASGFNATIDWGDGNTASGIINAAAGSFSVAGNHTYAAPGYYLIDVTIHDSDDQSATASELASANDQNSLFVAMVYRDVLRRAADAGGLQYWATQLDGATPQASVAADIDHSAEYYEKRVIQPAYLQLLGRPADQSGIQYWVQQMQNGATDEELEADLVSATDEFFNQHGATNSGWINGVYQELLGRPPDSAGLGYWQGQLNAKQAAGEPQPQALLEAAEGIANSNENNKQLVDGDYLGYLGRPADSAGESYWLTGIQAGQTNEDVVTDFTGSQEYYAEATNPPTGQPGSQLVLTGSFDPNATINVVFDDGFGHSLDVRPDSVTATSVTVTVPPFVNSPSADSQNLPFGAAPVTIAVDQSNGSATTVTPVKHNYQVGDLPTTGLPAGQITEDYLSALSDFVGEIIADCQSLAGVHDFSSEIQQLQSEQSDLIAFEQAIEQLMTGQVSSLDLGSVGGHEVFLTMTSLAYLDRLIYAVLLQNGTTNSGQSAAIVERAASSAIRFAGVNSQPDPKILAQRYFAQYSSGGAQGIDADLQQDEKWVNEQGTKASIAGSLLGIATGDNEATNAIGASTEFALCADISAYDINLKLNEAKLKNGDLGSVEPLLDFETTCLTDIGISEVNKNLVKTFAEPAAPNPYLARASELLSTLGESYLSGYLDGGNQSNLAAVPAIGAPGSLSVSGTAGQQVSGPTLTVTNSGAVGSMLNYSISTSDSHLVVSGSPRTLAAGAEDNLQISVDASDLAPKTYNWTITISSSDGRASAQTVNVTVTITAPAAIIKVNTSELTFTAPENEQAPAQQIQVTNGGPKYSVLQYTYTVDFTGPKFDLNIQGGPSNSLLKDDPPDIYTIQPDAKNLNPGTYSATLTFTSTDTNVKPVTVRITFVVTQDQSADIAVSVEGPPTINDGGVVQYQLDVKNNGPGTATNVPVVFTIAPTLDVAGFGNVQPSKGSIQFGDPGAFTWTLPTMAANESDSVQVPVNLLSGGRGDTLQATADVEPATLQQSDPDPNNNTASAWTNIT